MPPQSTSGLRPTMASPDYGIQAFLWWRPEVAHRDLGLVKDAGFTWVKQWFAWRDIEGKGKGQYDWETADRIVNQVEEFGLNLLVRVDHEPEWAGPPPGNIDHFVDFLTAVATRYKGRIHAYQVWNEPNLAREWGDKPPNAGEYTQMLKSGLPSHQSHRSQRHRHQRWHGAHHRVEPASCARYPIHPGHVQCWGQALL